MFTPTAEHLELRRTVRRFFETFSPEPVVRETMAGPSGLDPALWHRMANELGLLGMAVPEEFGGSGFGFAESCLVLEEAGRALVAAPLLSTLGLVVPTLLLAADDRARKQLLPAVVAGEVRVAVALPHQVDAAGARNVLDANAADVLLALTPTAGGVELVEIDLHDAGVEPREGLDLTRRSAYVRRTGVKARHIGPVDRAVTARIQNLAVVALAAEQTGGAQCALDAAVSYANLRVQFGRPIGSFQAVKHRLADMLVAVETARSVAYHAIAAAAGGTDRELAMAAAVAGAYCSEVYAAVAEDALQVHGGIGFTWEHAAHLWFRRAKADAVLFGTPASHRARLAELIE